MVSGNAKGYLRVTHPHYPRSEFGNDIDRHTDSDAVKEFGHLIQNAWQSPRQKNVFVDLSRRS